MSADGVADISSMRASPFWPSATLVHAKTVLLVDDDQTEVAEHPFLKQSVGADQHLDRPLRSLRALVCAPPPCPAR